MPLPSGDFCLLAALVRTPTLLTDEAKREVGLTEVTPGLPVSWPCREQPDVWEIPEDLAGDLAW